MLTWSFQYELYFFWVLGELLLITSRSLTPQELLLSIWHRNSISPTVRDLSRIAMLAGHSSCRVSRSGKLSYYLYMDEHNERAFRKKNVRKKLNAMALEFVGKNVLIVDGKLSCETALQQPTIIFFEIPSCVVRHRRKLFRWPKM